MVVFTNGRPDKGQYRRFKIRMESDEANDFAIAYGDFITVQELGFAAVREDEHIEFDANRTNVICGIRNVILSLCAPYPALAG